MGLAIKACFQFAFLALIKGWKFWLFLVFLMVIIMAVKKATTGNGF